MRLHKIYFVIGLCIFIPFTAWSKGSSLACKPQIYGGRGDGITINTKAIQKAIDICSQQGGGIVLFSEGVWLSGPISLKSNITLQLDKGTVLKATNKNHQFRNAFIDNSVQKGEAFILANHVHDVGITGQGTIDGGGQQIWWDKAKQINSLLHRGQEQVFKKEFPGVPIANGVPRPWLVEFNDVDNGRLNGVLLTNSPMWNVVLRNSQHIDITAIKIKNPKNSPNTDGIDIVSSQYIQVSDVYISTGDDNISIKSGLQKKNVLPPSDIMLQDSVMRDGHGISVGSENANGIGKITIQNIHFIGTTNGLRIKSKRDRGGKIGPVLARCIQMENVKNPIIISASYTVNRRQKSYFKDALQQKNRTLFTPLIHDISFIDINALNADSSVTLSGLPEAVIQNVMLDHIFMQAQYSLRARYVQGIIRNVIIKTKKQGAFFYLGHDAYLKQE